MRDALRSEEARLRKLATHHRTASQNATVASQVHAGARAAVQPELPLTRQEWVNIIKAGGGAGPMLDAMEQLIGAALRKVAAAANDEQRTAAGPTAMPRPLAA